MACVESKSGFVMMMTFKRCMIFIQGRSQYSCGVLKRLVVTARPLENDQEAVHHHKQVMHRKSHEAQPTMNPTKEIKLQRLMKHLLSWRRSMEINIPVNNCVPGLISFSWKNTVLLIPLQTILFLGGAKKSNIPSHLQILRVPLHQKEVTQAVVFLECHKISVPWSVREMYCHLGQRWAVSSRI